MILTEKDLKNVTFKQIKEDYEILRNFAIKNNIKTIENLNKYELFIFLTVDTLNFGRNLKDSIENALCHVGTENSILLIKKLYSGNIKMEIDANFIRKTYNL